MRIQKTTTCIECGKPSEGMKRCPACVQALCPDPDLLPPVETAESFFAPRTYPKGPGACAAHNRRNCQICLLHRKDRPC